MANGWRKSEARPGRSNDLRSVAAIAVTTLDLNGASLQMGRHVVKRKSVGLGKTTKSVLRRARPSATALSRLVAALRPRALQLNEEDRQWTRRRGTNEQGSFKDTTSRG